MPVKVSLVFSGLHMFVADDSRRVEHVLLPKAHPHEPHFFGLAYDDNATRAPIIGGPALDPVWKVIRLDGNLVRVANGSGLPIDTTVSTAEVVRLDEGLNFPNVDPAYKSDGEHKGKRVTGRVVLHAGHHDSPIVMASEARLVPLRTSAPGGPTPPSLPERKMAEHTPWTIDSFPSTTWPDGEAIELGDLLEIHDLWNRATSTPLPRLYADAQNMVTLVFIHAVKRAFPNASGRFPLGTNTGVHFAAYYDLASASVPNDRRFVPWVTKESKERLPKRFGKPASSKDAATRKGFSPSAFCSESQASFA
jgi:hypothetical protein